MCLLDVLCNLGADVIAVHLNHNWRGEESLKEAQNCEKFANSRGINYYSETLPDNIQKQKQPQERQDTTFSEGVHKI